MADEKKEIGVEQSQKNLDDLKAFYGAPGMDQHARLTVAADGKLSIERFETGVIKEVKDSDGTIVGLISTPRIDYVRDVMDPYGVKDEPLRKNRGVFYNHRWSGHNELPIGKNLWLRSTSDGVLVKTQYAINETAFAKDVFNLLVGGYLNSYSIGFIPDAYSVVTLTDLLKLIDGAFVIPNIGEFKDEDQIMYHSKWTVYEYSNVGVPMNMDAVRKALSDGLVKSDFGKEYFGGIVGREKLPIIGEVKTDTQAVPQTITVQTGDNVTITSGIEPVATTTISTGDDIKITVTPEPANTPELEGGLLVRMASLSEKNEKSESDVIDILVGVSEKLDQILVILSDEYEANEEGKAVQQIDSITTEHPTDTGETLGEGTQKPKAFDIDAFRKGVITGEVSRLRGKV